MGSLREQYEEMKCRAANAEAKEAERIDRACETAVPKCTDAREGTAVNVGDGAADTAVNASGTGASHTAEIVKAADKTTENISENTTENTTVNTEANASQNTAVNASKNASEKDAPSSAMLRRGLRFSYGIRLIAALYLFYVSFKMYQTRGLNSGMNQVVSDGFMIFFVVVAVFLLVNSIRGSKKLNDEMKKK